jgi:hypothetical protein
MRHPFPYSYYSALRANQQLISIYVKRIQHIEFLVIYGKLDSEVELIQQETARIKNSFEMSDPNKYRNTQDTGKYHPLALEYYQVQQQLAPYYNKQHCKLTTEMQSLAAKGELLFGLSQAEINGFYEKLEKLVSKDLEEYEKIFYEMTVAGHYLSRGHNVKFIETSSIKSADLLIDDAIEIECKSKDLVHPYYRKYQDIWEIIVRKAPEWMDRVRLNYLIYVVFTEEIDTPPIKLLKNKIHEIIYEKKEGTFKIDSERISIEAKILLPFDLEIDKPMIKENFPEILKAIPNISETDFMQHFLNIYRTSEKIIQKNFRYLAMKIPKHPPRSIISNIKGAVNQVKKSFPSIIYVDISSINKKMKLPDLNELEKEVYNFLHANSSINAIVITDNYMTETNGVADIKNGIWVLRNSFVAHDLPSAFTIPYEKNSSKESLISNMYLL